MRTSVLAIVIAGCNHGVIPSQEDPPDAYVAPVCLNSGDYNVLLTLDYSECPAVIASDDDDPYYCEVPSLDIDQVVGAYKPDALQCGAASSLTTTWSINANCADDGVTGTYGVDWRIKSIIDDAVIGGTSYGPQMTLGGTAEDGFDQPAMFASQLAIENTNAFSGELVVTFTAFDGGSCDEHYKVTTQ